MKRDLFTRPNDWQRERERGGEAGSPLLQSPSHSAHCAVIQNYLYLLLSPPRFFWSYFVRQTLQTMKYFDKLQLKSKLGDKSKNCQVIKIKVRFQLLLASELKRKASQTSSKPKVPAELIKSQKFWELKSIVSSTKVVVVH